MGTFPNSLLTIEKGRTGTEISVWPVNDAAVPPLPLMSVGQEICLVGGATYVILKVTVDEHCVHGDASDEDRAFYVWKYQVEKAYQ